MDNQMKSFSQVQKDRIAFRKRRSYSTTNYQNRMPAELSEQAYLKPLLHSTRHAHDTVLGLLVCEQVTNPTTLIVDAIPLRHAWTTLRPMTEAALTQVRLHG